MSHANRHNLIREAIARGKRNDLNMGYGGCRHWAFDKPEHVAITKFVGSSDLENRSFLPCSSLGLIVFLHSTGGQSF